MGWITDMSAMECNEARLGACIPRPKLGGPELSGELAAPTPGAHEGHAYGWKQCPPGVEYSAKFFRDVMARRRLSCTGRATHAAVGVCALEIDHCLAISTQVMSMSHTIHCQSWHTWC
jgi:hypothetical protein